LPLTPVDPLEGPKFALAGRIVAMDSAFTDIPRGVLYGERGSIVAVQEERAPPPVGFETLRPVATGGTLFPGLIELHNHLSYNALRLWDVPKKFTNRDQWGGTPEYRRLVSGPMQVVGSSSTLMPALVRYVECKSLLGGVTTSQGIALFSNRGARRFYRGLVRNVEQTDEPDFPEAATRIADVDAVDAERFFARLLKQKCFLLHLSEGIDTAAREHFLALHIAPRQWAITDTLAGIHCAGLWKADLSIFANRGGAMIWSPLSNLLLYGATARIAAAKTEGVRIGLGSDWSPTGSKNLLGELKAAFLASEAAGSPFSDREVVAMATRGAAEILKWENVLGSLEAGKRADVLVLEGTRGDPYGRLLAADERSIRLLLINGVPRMGLPSLMASLGADGESVRVGGRLRILNLKQRTADPVVGAMTLVDARDTLKDGLRRLPELAREQETAPERAAVPGRAVASEPLTWFLALDELADTGVELRPRLPLPGRRSFTGPELRAAAEPLSTILQPLELDPLTVADDEDFLDRISAQRNLPAYVSPGLRELYPG
jgi:5-methylthioadenosine/S-adenosylhomocysteine deaminase